MATNQPAAMMLQTSTQSVLMQLMNLTAQDSSRESEAYLLSQITELAARGVGVARASVWLREGDTIVAQDLFDARNGFHGGGTVLNQLDYPEYFVELDRAMVIVANDARSHSATACFTETYLKPLGITAMLDAPIWRGGRSVGVLCLEHVGGERGWTDAETAYAAQVALICSLFFERSERLAAERALHVHDQVERQVQKMEALGRMASAVGHDFNNLFTAIIAHTQLIVRNAHNADQVTQHGEQVLEAAEIAAELAQRLLSFGKGREPSEFDLNLVTTIRALEPVLRNVISKSISLTLELPAEAIIVRADAASIEQILVNLVLNARDAVGEVGRITISVSYGFDDKDRPAVLMDVSDTGVGMDENTVAHIFEPFFVTNRKRGSGLGLATCFNIMRRLGGTISVQSIPGLGSVCRCIFSPRA